MKKIFTLIICSLFLQNIALSQSDSLLVSSDSSGVYNLILQSNINSDTILRMGNSLALIDYQFVSKDTVLTILLSGTCFYIFNPFYKKEEKWVSGAYTILEFCMQQDPPHYKILSSKTLMSGKKEVDLADYPFTIPRMISLKPKAMPRNER